MLEAGHGDLLDLLRDLDPRLAAARDELVHAAERGLRLACDEVGAHCEGVDLVALLSEREQGRLIDVVGGDDHQPAEGHAHPDREVGELGARDLGEVGEVAAVESDADGLIAGPEQP